MIADMHGTCSRRRRVLLGLVFLGAGSVGGMAARPSGPPAGLLSRVVVIGASVSDGFGLPTKLGDVLNAAIRDPHEEPVSLANSLLFFSPGSQSKAQVGELLDTAEPPTLVLALDFVFWFGYGDVAANGTPMATHEERLANLESALSLLAQLSVPVAVGDFPDMSPAIGLMLGESQVPNPGTLVALNERLHAWAQGRDQVLILPLAKSVLDVRADRGFKIGNETWPAGRASGLIQLDRLHPTLEGMCVLGAMIGHGLVEAGWAESGAFAPASEVLASLRVPVRAAENVMEDR